MDDSEVNVKPFSYTLHLVSEKWKMYILFWLWKKGYAYEAAHAFFDYLFHEKSARRIYAYTEDDNVSSQKLCEKLGMRREGLFKEFISFVNDSNGNPIYENTVQYAILKKEWDS